VFHDTLGFCFDSALRDMLGLTVRDSVYGLLERSGITRGDVANRFDETVDVLVKGLGAASRVLVHRTLVELFGQYSLRLDFSYKDSLRDRLWRLKEEVVDSHIIPRRLQEASWHDEVSVLNRAAGKTA
jgi:hypothetical protein